MRNEQRSVQTLICTMEMKSLDINFSLIMLERMGKGEYSSSGYILEVKETNKKERNKQVSLKEVSLELKIVGGHGWNLDII